MMKKASELLEESAAPFDSACMMVREMEASHAKLRDAANVALGHLTGGMDGDWRDCDPVELLREALSS